MVCRRMNTVIIWRRHFERYICIYVCHSAPKFGSGYHHMERTCHILFPNFRLHQSQCFKNCLWLNLQIYDNSFFIIFQNTHVVSIWQKDFMLDEMCFKMECTRESDMPTSLGTNCIHVSTVKIILLSWLPARNSHRLARFRCIFYGEMPVSNFYCYLQNRCLIRLIDPYTSLNTLKSASPNDRDFI